MRTDKQRSGSAGRFQFQHHDDSGVAWEVTGQWSVIAGRVECSALALDSGGQGLVTSTLVRQVEREVRAWREKHAADVRKIAKVGAGTDAGRRAARQVPAFDQERSTMRPRGRPRQDDVLLAQAQAVRAAWERREPLLAALEALDPGWEATTYRKRLDRVRKWDRETGTGLLDGVGRARRSER